MSKRHSPKLSAELEIELRDRLEDTLDEIDDVTDKRRRLARHLGGHLKVLAETRDLVRRQLKGIDLDQLEIPGTEKPEPARDPLVSEILRIAGGIVEAKPAPAPLEWREVEEGLKAADAPGGLYHLEQCDDGAWTATWDPSGGGKNKLLVLAKPESEARAACTAHHLDLSGDEILKNAGDGAMTKADLKGPAERFKKRG